MTGKTSGVVARVKTVAPNIISTHCMIHRAALASKNIGASLSDVLSSCVQIIDHIKTRPLSARIFALLCEEMGADYQNLLLHTEVRWLSRGRVLKRVFDLREELVIFLTEYNANLASLVVDVAWLAKLAYLVDIFGALNELNLSLQGTNTNILRSHGKISAFKRNCAVGKPRLTMKSLTCFLLCLNISSMRPCTPIEN